MMIPLKLVCGVLGGGMVGKVLCDVTPISEQTTLTIGLVCSLVVTAFGVGVVLTGLKRDIKELKTNMADLKKQIDKLPCHKECPSVEISDKED